ncbi:uncharacterized protein LOC142622770 isoform X4 [Castanea sativa]|uniref:uncharacterized protein LOC142622770 isoform X4 n=1 Tax=Castanea sativa TaxID=21020 RepID=UPI003F65268F
MFTAGKSNGLSSNRPSSSNGPQSHQILCCAYNANRTVFVTVRSDTFARVWSDFKCTQEDLDQPVPELDLLSSHENDVNYLQFRKLWERKPLFSQSKCNCWSKCLASMFKEFEELNGVIT